jgi:hypothetical protein
MDWTQHFSVSVKSYCVSSGILPSKKKTKNKSERDGEKKKVREVDTSFL